MYSIEYKWLLFAVLFRGVIFFNALCNDFNGFFVIYDAFGFRVSVAIKDILCFFNVFIFHDANIRIIF